LAALVRRVPRSGFARPGRQRDHPTASSRDDKIITSGSKKAQCGSERRTFLSQWTKDHHVPYRDLTDVIQKAGIDNVYIADNWHWNAAGHRVAAQQLKDLLQEVLNPTSQSSKADIR